MSGLSADVSFRMHGGMWGGGGIKGDWVTRTFGQKLTILVINKNLSWFRIFKMLL
jgi:hypothetical protein